MKSKAGVLCISWCDADDVINYGQVLQALSMMLILREKTEGKIKYISYYPRGKKGRARYVLKHIDFRNGHLQSYIKTRKIIKKIIKENKIEFYQIQGQSISSSITDNIDIMICGGDQIWHPQSYKKEYYLDFGKGGLRRAAFAVSLPKTKVESQFISQFEKISEKLKKIDNIAVREEGSVDFISRLSGKKVISVLDPTYLIFRDNWERLIEKVDVEGAFIFVYIPNGMDEKMLKLVNKVKKQIDIDKVLVLVTRGTNYFEDSLKFVSVGQFLYLIKNAECVITSSFHAVVFSTIFHTDFYCYDVPNESRGEDIRLINILSLFNMQNRLIKDMDCVYEHIDFSNCDQIIKYNREKSFQYLENVLK